MQTAIFDLHREMIKNNKEIGKNYDDMNSQFKSEMLQCAIYYRKINTVKLLIESGSDLSSPPSKLTTRQDEGKQEESTLFYVETPFIIQAVKSGSIEILELLLKKGRALNEEGFIGYSPKRGLSIFSNVFAAAVYNEKIDIAEYLLTNQKINELEIERKCKEKGTGKRSIPKELNDYTPLMLSVVRGNISMFELLLNNNLNRKVLDSSGNNLMHIAVKYEADTIIKLLDSNFPEMKLERNVDGHTPIILANNSNNEKIKTLLKLENPTDKLDILEKKENQIKERKEKKQRRKKMMKEKMKKSKLAAEEKNQKEIKSKEEPISKNESEDSEDIKNSDSDANKEAKSNLEDNEMKESEEELGDLAKENEPVENEDLKEQKELMGLKGQKEIATEENKDKDFGQYLEANYVKKFEPEIKENSQNYFSKKPYYKYKPDYESNQNENFQGSSNYKGGYKKYPYQPFNPYYPGQRTYYSKPSSQIQYHVKSNPPNTLYEKNDKNEKTEKNDQEQIPEKKVEEGVEQKKIDIIPENIPIEDAKVEVKLELEPSKVLFLNGQNEQKEQNEQKFENMTSQSAINNINEINFQILKQQGKNIQIQTEKLATIREHFNLVDISEKEKTLLAMTQKYLELEKENFHKTEKLAENDIKINELNRIINDSSDKNKKSPNDFQSEINEVIELANEEFRRKEKEDSDLSSIEKRFAKLTKKDLESKYSYYSDILQIIKKLLEKK